MPSESLDAAGVYAIADGSNVPCKPYAAAEELLEKIGSYNANVDRGLITKAYAFAERKHAAELQLRASGEPYFMHPVAVAEIIVEMQLDDTTVVTALLHDTLEDTETTHRELVDEFGGVVADLVAAVTRLTKKEWASPSLSDGGILRSDWSEEDRQADHIRRIMEGSKKDKRALIVKIADRLHNMRTVQHLPKDKQIRKSTETLEYFAPIAERLGLQSWREELEDIAFKIVFPSDYRSVLRNFARLRREISQEDKPNEVVYRFQSQLENLLEEREITATVSGRLKRPFSIWRKMRTQNLELKNVFDVFGFRIITESRSDVYRAMGAVHEKWPAIPGKFKDYISNPKKNGYRSLHTTISSRSVGSVEIQIRTRLMHELAERGIASHYAYRGGVRIKSEYATDFGSWISEISDGAKITTDNAEFLKFFKLKVAHDIVCFTPGGLAKDLPKDSTVLNFAYAVHTEIGDSARPALIDGELVSLDTRLSNGQTIQVIMDPRARPQPEWMAHARTTRARSSIQRALNRKDHEARVKRGREIAEREFARFDRTATDELLTAAARKLKIRASSLEEMLACLAENYPGGGFDRQEPGQRLTVDRVIRAALPGTYSKYTEMQRELQSHFDNVPKGRHVEVARCCMPLPPEEIQGCDETDNRIAVHARDCKLVDGRAPVDASISWRKGLHRSIHTALIEANLNNLAGVLGRICSLIGKQEANITDLGIVERLEDRYRMRFQVQVRDMSHLLAVMDAIDRDQDTGCVSRCRTAAREESSMFHGKCSSALHEV